MADTWKEVETVIKKKTRELVLSGKEISERIDYDGLDENIFTLTSINFLQISNTTLKILPPSIGKLTAVTKLVLYGNALTDLPDTISDLPLLNLLDISSNKLNTLPSSIANLDKLVCLKVESNELTEFPDVSGMTSLRQLHLVNNKLESFPEGCANIGLSFIDLGSNRLKEIPIELPEESLKHLDVSNNLIIDVPTELSMCTKLSYLDCTENKVKDRYIKKIIESMNTKPKKLLEYLAASVDGGGKGKKGKKGKKSKKKKQKASAAGQREEEEQHLPTINVARHPEEGGITIAVNDNTQTIRPYIVAAVVTNLDLQREANLFKRFLALQTKLHDEECQKRQTATIATHDLTAIKMPLIYKAQRPGQMRIAPLGYHRNITAHKYMEKLHEEAEAFRKEKKRNTISGIHKYLDLLKDKPLYPCLVDKDDVVISFPPITNCNSTKISPETTSILIEVTSSISYEVCKEILDVLLKNMLEMELGSAPIEKRMYEMAIESGSESEEEDQECVEKGASTLNVVQVKITDQEGTMKLVYPSRADLQHQDYRVIRDYK